MDELRNGDAGGLGLARVEGDVVDKGERGFVRIL